MNDSRPFSVSPSSIESSTNLGRCWINRVRYVTKPSVYSARLNLKFIKRVFLLEFKISTKVFIVSSGCSIVSISLIDLLNFNNLPSDIQCFCSGVDGKITLRIDGSPISAYNNTSKVWGKDIKFLKSKTELLSSKIRILFVYWLIVLKKVTGKLISSAYAWKRRRFPNNFCFLPLLSSGVIIGECKSVISKFNLGISFAIRTSRRWKAIASTNDIASLT